MESVALGTITAGELRVEYVKSLLASRSALDDGPAVIAESLIHVAGPYLDDARNVVVDTFLESCESDILLFADSDISWTRDDVRHVAGLIDAESSPVVGGLYYSGFDRLGFAPVAYRWGTHPDTSQPFLRQIEVAKDETNLPDRIKVDAIGTGFLAIHRSLLTRMPVEFPGPQPWFAEETYENIHHGEDFTFCLRLATMGVPIYLAPNARVKHHKVCTL